MESDERKPPGFTKAERNSNSTSGVKRFFFAPLIGLHRLTDWLLEKAFGGLGEITEDDILSMVDVVSESGGIEETSAEIIANAFEFDDLEVSDVMTHRINVVGIQADSELDALIYTALDKGFSRLPVYGRDLDDIIGIIITKDLLTLVGKSEDELAEYSVRSFLREAVCIPETNSCTSLFKMLQEKKSGMAVVIDEDGGTAGIITIEDLVEEIMGSIQDEYDGSVKEPKIEKIGDEKYAIDGEADPEEVLKLFGYELPEDHEYETLAGFVTDLLGFIPEQSTTNAATVHVGGAEDGHTPYADYNDVRFVVREMEAHYISRIIAYRAR